MRHLKPICLGLGLMLLSFGLASGADQKIKAPEWVISEWINGDGVKLSDLRGKVVVVEFFQLWCPGCNNFSIPLMKKWGERTFKKKIDDGSLVILSIHTVFEGHSYQSPRRLRSFVKAKGIHHLVGIDKHVDGNRLPETMKRYRTRGTPAMAFIDKNGNIRAQVFGSFDPQSGEDFVRALIREPAA